ncbi:NAD(P)H-hydrate dehydratase [Sinirhodobacter populi]|uniref:ADP-dependent (S)-NAD(P)H-hydrate dehydratase n=2 Tax=Paenirhodobacter populi TaxID=2306993 RepID=A0A443JVA7_9RHOB|nr:NAD(P)H-hydrate dehydratase [Sinirhodobacter populi]
MSRPTRYQPTSTPVPAATMPAAGPGPIMPASAPAPPIVTAATARTPSGCAVPRLLNTSLTMRPPIHIGGACRIIMAELQRDRALTAPPPRANLKQGPSPPRKEAVPMTRLIVADAAMRNLLAKREDAHKYVYGHALVLSGGPGKGGAARLAARAALRVGAGLVTVAAPQPAIAEHAAQLNAVMLTPLPDSYSLRGMLTQDKRLNALLLGPGMGINRAREMVPAALWAERATVLDADAITAFAENPVQLFGMLHDKVVLTPHMGEFGRLFPDLAQAAKDGSLTHVEATRHAADRAGCTVLLKGAETAIAAPTGETALHRAVGSTAAPWLATAGSGDVLSGIVTGLLARGLSPFEAAGTGAWLHAAAARAYGPGLISEDLPEMLPRVFADLGL